jgi:PAS domain S-box-containing protein
LRLTFETEIERLTRLYAALSRINKAIVRVPARDALFARVCEALVDEGGFRMAWIGWHDATTSRLVPVAVTGDEHGYIARLDVRTDESPLGDGPSGRAFRFDRAYVCNDVLSDPVTLPWRDALARSELRASAVFPIHVAGRVGGTLSVYADRPDIFRDKEISLLEEAAADLSFALDNLERESARASAEAVVEHFRAIIESTDDAILSCMLDGTVVTCNPAAQRMFGHAPEHVVGRSVLTLVPPERAEEEREILRQIIAGSHVEQYETERLHRDGHVFPVSITASPIFADGPIGNEIVGVSKIVRDISARRAAEATAERERRFVGHVIDAMPGVMYLYTTEGRFLRWNRNFETVSGYTAAEIAQMHPLDFFRGDDRRRVEERIGDVFAHGESTIAAGFISKDGTATPYFFTGKRITFEDGVCLVGVGVDVADRQRAEIALRKSEERYRTTLDSIFEGCQIIGFDWRYLYLNDAASVQNRRRNSELLGRRMQDAWPGIEASAVFKLLERSLVDRVPVHEEVEFMFPDGTSGWYDVRSQPVPEGIFVLSIEVTKRRRAEQALRELNESLERKVAERTRDLEAARVQAEAADRTKSAFLATMSHELRTPLNSIIGFTGLVLQGLAGPLTGEQTTQLGMVRSSARHLLDLINDVLDISKIEAGQLEVRFARFDLLNAIDRVTSSVRPLAEKKVLALDVVAPATLAPIESDRRRVEQILLNLLNNAIKFTDRGSVAVVVEEVGERVRVAVRDTGIGIAPENLGKLFQPFRQIDVGLERQHEGTGLGLAICKRLSDLLGATLAVTSEPGQGSTFTVELPRERGQTT